MIACDMSTAEAALHVLLAANHLASNPDTPERTMAVLAYLALATLRLVARERQEAGDRDE